CSPEVRLGRRTRRIDVEHLGSHPLLLLNRSFAVREAFDAACRVAGFKPNIAFESRTPHTLLALAEAGVGIAVVPSLLPTHRYNRRTIVLTRLSRPLQEAYALVFDNRRSHPPVFDEFCRALERHVREMLPLPSLAERRMHIGRRRMNSN